MNETLRQELLRMLELDQQYRVQTVHGGPDDSQAELDRSQVDQIKRIIHQYGFPGKSLVGDDGANAAWVLIQHADHDPEFQETCLPLVRKAAESGELRMALYATLEDRIRTNAGKPQKFGTIMMIQLNHASMEDGDYRISVAQIEDLVQVDELRRGAGMEPLREAMINQLSQVYAMHRFQYGTDVQIDVMDDETMDMFSVLVKAEHRMCQVCLAWNHARTELHVVNGTELN